MINRKLTKKEAVDVIDNIFKDYENYKLEVEDTEDKFLYKVIINPDLWYELEFENSINEDRTHRRSSICKTFAKWENTLRLKKYESVNKLQ